ncbi:Zinc phosphodiesterase ELAC protein 1 [Sparganum proliferum]
MDIIFLGTGSAFPTPNRAVSGIILRNSATNVQWLFDCEARIKRITRIFITHMHGDHVYGLPGLMATLAHRMQGEERGPDDVDVEIYGPQGLRRYLRLALSLAWALLDITYTVHELMFSPRQTVVQDYVKFASTKTHPDYDPILPYERPGRDIYPDENGLWRNIFGPEGPPGPVGDVKTNFTVHAVPLRHTVPSVGWLLVESPSPPRMMMEKVNELGVPPGPLLGKLKKGQTITFKRDGVDVTVSPDQVVGPGVRGRRIAICGDSGDSSALADLLRLEFPNEEPVIDTLVHEATVHSAHGENTYEKGHTSAAGAAKFAASIGVRQLILTHFSQRYISYSPAPTTDDGSKLPSLRAEDDVTRLLDDAKSCTEFKGVIKLAEDLKTLKLLPV